MKQLENYIDNWGRYQWYVYTLMFLPGFVGGIQALVYSFTIAAPNVRCRLPDVDQVNSSYEDIFDSTFWRQIYAPPNSEGGKNAYCTYCPSGLNASSAANCTSNAAIPCDHGYIYDYSQYKSSLAMNYEMVCPNGKWKAEVAKSLYMVGILLGASIFGTLSDKFGRKTIFMIGSICLIITSNLTPITPNYYVFCLFQIFNGAFGTAPFLCGFVLTMEISKGYPRTIAGIWFQGYFAMGYIYVGVLAYLIRDWKWLMWACSLPGLLFIPYFWLLPESFRWLVVEGKADKAKDELQRLFRYNNVKVSEQEIDDALLVSHEECNENVKATVRDLFKHWTLAKNTLIVFYTWFAVSMCYYGLSLNANDLPGNDYVNFLALGIAEIPGYIICILLMEKFGRVPSLVFTMGVGGLLIIIIAFLKQQTVIIVLAFVGKMLVAGAFAVIYNYSAEMFPTVVRSAGSGFSSVCARVGSIAAPQIHLLATYVSPWVPFVIYGAFAVVAAVLDLLLPETKGKQLPETLEDGINFSKPKSQINQKSRL